MGVRQEESLQTQHGQEQRPSCDRTALDKLLGEYNFLFVSREDAALQVLMSVCLSPISNYLSPFISDTFFDSLDSFCQLMTAFESYPV